MLFAWRTRANCYFCFNQRYYEWIGLLEHYPELFWNAEAMEHKGSDGVFTWNANKTSLQEMYDRRDYFKGKRINYLVKFITNLIQGVLPLYDDEEDFADILTTTSCGLFCGK